MRAESLQLGTWYLIELDSKIQIAYYHPSWPGLPMTPSFTFIRHKSKSIFTVDIPLKDVYKRVFSINKLWKILYEA